MTVYSDYALRMLMYLAVKEDELATIADIAEAYGISKNHLMKVAHELGLVGFVETVRGRGGGLRLARPREEITIGEVVRHTERLTWRLFRASRRSMRIAPSSGAAC